MVLINDCFEIPLAISTEVRSMHTRKLLTYMEHAQDCSDVTFESFSKYLSVPVLGHKKWASFRSVVIITFVLLQTCETHNYYTVVLDRRNKRRHIAHRRLALLCYRTATSSTILIRRIVAVY